MNNNKTLCKRLVCKAFFDFILRGATDYGLQVKIICYNI
jgi:hypothetical protein